jgi:hypothetical protein
MKRQSFFGPALQVTLFCVISLFLRAQTANTPPSDSSKSWTATTESQLTADQNPTQMTETHKQIGNRTVDTQSVQRRGMDGHFEPYYDTEKETIRVNATTVRTVTRTFGRDGSGQKSLMQVTDEEKISFPGGGEKMVRTTSNPDLEGHLPIVQREVSETRKTGPEAQETKTTVFLPDASGGLAPSMQTVEQKKRSSEHAIEVQKSTLLLDGGGNWQVHELKQSTIKEDGNNNVGNRTIEEQVSRPGSDGRLAVVSRTVTRESETAPGERHEKVETYSTDIPGSAPDGNLHVSRRVTTVRRARSDGQQSTEQQLEQPNPASPASGLQVTQKTIEVVSTDGSGKLQTRTLEVPDASGSLSVVSVETRKSTQTQSAPPDTAPPPQDKDKDKD